ncbi:MAG: hypothetical protein V2A71_00660 [Candidatus Eisenbacteria bacterium]
MSAKVFFVAVLLLATFAAAGCYTVLKHPEGTAMMDESYQRKSCMDCHASTQFYHYDPYWYGYYYPYSWWDYYGSPWWYRDYWYYGSPGESAPVEEGGRHMWSAPSLRAPDPSVYKPVVRPPEGKSGEGSEKKPPESSKTQEKKDEQKDKKRHMWSR